MHTLRWASSAEHPSLQQVDGLLLKDICTITDLGLSHLQSFQASLSVKDSGLGVRRITSLAPSACFWGNRYK